MVCFNPMRGLISRIIITAFLSLLCTASVSAQTSYLSTYGFPGCMERGLSGIEPVAAGGFISAGETWSFGPSCSNSDIYVVRTDNGGNVIWSNSYDIVGSMEQARDIYECSNGDFIITGTTYVLPPASPDDAIPPLCCCSPNNLFVMRLDPNGNVKWIRSFGNDRSQGGVCLYETTEGNGTTTFPGDIIVGGWSVTVHGDSIPGSIGGGTQNPNTDADAYLLRLTAAGKLLWSQVYDLGYADTVRAITPSTVPGPGGSGTIVAAIESTLPLNPVSTLMRFDATTGINIGSGTGIAIFMAPVRAGLIYSVQKSRVGPNTGNIIIAGRTTEKEIYAAIVNANFHMCTPPAILQNLVVASTTPTQNSIAYAVREIQTGPPGVLGNLILTGFTNIVNPADRDIYLLELSPVLAIQNFFSYSPGPMQNVGFAIAEVPDGNPLNPPGCIISGVVDDANPGAELLQMRLNNTWTLGSCPGMAMEIEDYSSTHPETNASCGLPLSRLPLNPFCIPPVTIDNRSGSTIICQPMMPAPRDGEPGNGTSEVRLDNRPMPVISLRNDATIESYPNPVQKGTKVMLNYALTRRSSISITVVDISGKPVYSHSGEYAGGDHEIPVSTTGWASGSYIIHLKSEGSTATQRITVIDR